MSTAIREIEKAREWLGREWLSAMFEDGTPTPQSKKLWERFLNRLATLFFIDTDGKVKNLSRLVSENWDGKSVYPLDLPPVLLIELAAEDNALIQDLSVPVRKKIGAHLLENSAHLEELFVAFGLRDPEISKRFGNELSPPDWSEVETRLLAAKKRPRFLSWLPLRVAAFLSALLLLGKNAFSKPVTILWTAGSLATLAVGIGVVATVASSEEGSLRWNFRPSMSVNLVKSGTVEIRQDGQFVSKSEEKNLISFYAKDVHGDRADFEGSFKTFYLKEGSPAPVLYRTFTSKFTIQNSGAYQVPESQIQPSIRSIPSFPRKDLKPGDSWSAPFELVYHDTDPAFIVSTNAHYTWLSNRSSGATNFAVIEVVYSFFEKIGGRGANQIAFLQLTNESEILWNLTEGLPYFQRDRLTELLTFGAGQKLLIRSRFETVYDVTYPIAKSQMKKAEEEIKLALGQRKDAETYVDEKGIHVRMKEILFPFDSSSLNSSSTSVLASILPVLKKYKDYEIFVEGHTDNVGAESYNQGLSENRARSVADYLARGENFPKIYVKGQGSKSPIADNKAEDGRQMNRRVEITIRQTGEKTPETQQP